MHAVGRCAVDEIATVDPRGVGRRVCIGRDRFDLVALDQDRCAVEDRDDGVVVEVVDGGGIVVPLARCVLGEKAYPIDVVHAPGHTAGHLLFHARETGSLISGDTIMGGAVQVPGNVGPSSQIENDVAEWNFYIDPQAAALVFKSGAPLTLVPLDATNHVPLSIEFYNRLEVDRTTSVAEFVFQVLAAQEENVRSGWYYFWDPLAAAVVRDEDLVSFQDLSLEVIEAEGPESGWTKKSAAGSSLRVALTADRERFESLFLDVINDRLP